ncbi:MAG: TIGR03016 family PEP-CTERM system-associated outer membrane protein [Gammaproteobacteria bacterium]|nr:TIGR03016 family PEP-CTERM system-associated outer membrane protein [Gammaproteobacteria bacterium]
MRTVPDHITMSSFAVCTVATLLASNAAVAATNYEISANVTPSITYSDNICLSNDNEKDGWFASLTPSAAISGKSRKSRFSVRGSINLNTLTNSLLNSKGCIGNFDDRNRYNPEFFGNFNTVLVSNLLDVSARARVGQNEVSTRFRGGDDEFDRTGTGNTFYRYSVTPRVRYRLNSSYSTTASYTFDEVLNDNRFLTDSRRHAVVGTLNYTKPSNWTRSARVRSSRLEYDENFNGVQRRDSEFTSLRFNLGYRFSNKLSVNGSIGHEWNNFQTLIPRDEDGNAWQATVLWTPSPRTTVSVGQGDRFFGRTPRINISHQHKRSHFTARYARELRFRRDITTEDLEGFPLDIENISNPALYTETPIIEERLSAGWAWKGRASTLALTGNYSEQTRTEDGEEAIFRDVRVTFIPQWSGTYNFSGSLGWRDDEPRGRLFDLNTPIIGDASSQAWTMTLTTSRTLSSRLNVALTYVFTDRTGNTTLADYQENRITASFGIRF